MENNKKLHIGDKAWFIHISEKKIKRVTVVSCAISTTGHLLHEIVDEKNLLWNAEPPLLFENKAEAVKLAETYYEISKKIKKIYTDSNRKADELREIIHGKPEFPQYAQTKTPAKKTMKKV